MDSRTRATLAVGVAAGYVVCRTNKERLALGLFSLVTGRALDPLALLGQGIRKLAETPQFEQLSESLIGVLEQQTRSLADSGTTDEEPEPDGEADEQPDDEADEADSGTEGSAADEQDSPEDEQETGEPDQDEEEEEEEDAEDEEAEEPDQDAADQDAPPPAGRATTAKPSAREAGPKNPGAAKAKALGSKARAERSARKPGPQNPPAAKAAAKAAARRTASKQAAGGTAAGKTAPARNSRNSRSG